MTNKWIMTAAICLCTTTIAMAGPTVKVQTSPYQVGQGGEFLVTILAPGLPDLPAGSQFATFCVEMNEYITLGNSYYAKVLTYSDRGGGRAE